MARPTGERRETSLAAIDWNQNCFYTHSCNLDCPRESLFPNKAVTNTNLLISILVYIIPDGLGVQAAC